MTCELVWTNTQLDAIHVPDAMGQPGDGQLVGTNLEILAELAGRICYDSLGRGRTSEEWHQHVQAVGHLSVYEHCVVTIELLEWRTAWAEILLNRPGLHFRRERGVPRLTLNLRTLLDWDQHGDGELAAKMLGEQLRRIIHPLAPQVIPPARGHCIGRVVPPQATTEAWATLWLQGSRGFSHELVRHGDWTAISQRSTRYVDESESPMCWHPTLLEGDEKTGRLLDEVAEHTRNVYRHLAGRLIEQGCDLKTARGAARGALPNALETQLLFSASLRQWTHIFSLRCAPAADGEIRNLMTQAREILLGDRYARHETA